jgi:hypothetical protein
MIVEETVHYKFPQVNKIHYFSPAYDNTVVVIVLAEVGKDALMHYSQNKLLYSYQFGDFVDTLCMPDDEHVLVLRPEDDYIYLFNLRQKSFIKILHHFSVDVSCQCYLHYFCETNLVAIQ